jgi:hypothetical protein
VKSGRRILLAALVMLAGLALGAEPAATSWQGDAQLRITSSDSSYPQVHVALDVATAPGAPGRITIYVPRGFAIYPDRPAGSAVGSVEITALDDSYGSSTESLLAGDIVAQPPSTTTPTCAVGAYTGIWELELSLLGQPFDVPLYVADTGDGDPPGAATKLTLCAPTLPTSDPATARAFPISTVDLFLSGLEPPQHRGSYLWRALVTPLAPDRRTLLPDHTYELRAVVPVPHRLTLTGRYVSVQHLAVLHGRLTANGTPRAHVLIRVIALVRRITPDGAIVEDRIAGSTRTSSTGAYSFRAPMKKTTGFVAIAQFTATACQGPRIAPAGCQSTTLPATQSDPITVTVR